MKHWNWSAVVLLVPIAVGCATTPQHGPKLEVMHAPLAGVFVGHLSITNAYNADKPVHANCDITVTFYNGEYIITGNDDVVTSSSGRYGMGQQFLLRHEDSNRVGIAAHQVLRGLFDYQWSRKLLVLEQWDPAQDRLTQIFLERISTANPLLPYKTPNADAAGPPFGPPRRTASTQ